MTCSGERDSVAETALSLGRKVEVFVADIDTHSEVSRHVEASFEAPYREGYLEVIPRGANRVCCRRNLTLLLYEVESTNIRSKAGCKSLTFAWVCLGKLK